MKNILLTILGTIIFFGGAYFMGNYILDTFNDDIVEQIMSSVYGILLWAGIGLIALIICWIYKGICAVGE